MKLYDEKKICFIICTNNKQYLEECLLYLSQLEVPEGYEIELLTIEGAISMTSGYNEAMNASDAKYKIYLHQDTFVVDRKLLYKLLELFQSDPQIGMIGTIGSEKLSKSGVMWYGKRCGDFYRLDEFNKAGDTNIEKIKKGYREVEVVDGLFIATQYDIPWREDLLDGWDFYDVSQCLEFRRAGYKIIVPAQNPEWVIHDCGVPGYWKYYKYRPVVIKEYKEFFEKDKSLRILFVHSNRIILAGLVAGLMELGHEVIEAPKRIDIFSVQEKDKEVLEEELEVGCYDLVVSYDFIATASVVCQEMGVKYYSWVYDSPLLQLYTDTAQNSMNYITVFDRIQYERLQEQNLAHLKHFPLATEVNLFGGLEITPEDEKKYSAEVCFLGRLYEKRGFEEIFQDAPKEYMEEAERVLQEGLCQWNGENYLYGKASDKVIAYMAEKQGLNKEKKFNMDNRFYCESMLFARKRNEYERVAILNEIAKKHKLVLYTENVNQEALKNVEIRPWVNYLTEMPKVFYLSKININISSRSIESGIPQRVWDILAVGGFCLTNYQPELEEYFEIGKDLEVYHNMQELMEKIEYYLKHEQARIRIGMNGYQKVKKYHSYEKRMEEVLNWIFEDVASKA